MTPASAASMLNRQLASHGENIELWHETGSQKIPFKIGVRALVRDYSPEELVGGIAQTDSRVTVSGREIIGTGWPGPNSSATPTEQDRRIPHKGDVAIIAGRRRIIEFAGPIYMAGELVRINMRVLG